MKSCQSMLAASVLATLLLASGVWAQGPRTDVLVTGEHGRSYHEFGSNLVKLLPAFRLENRISSGSVENLGLLADGKADLGFAQADVYARSLHIAPDRYSKLVVVGRTHQMLFPAWHSAFNTTNKSIPKSANVFHYFIFIYRKIFFALNT